MKTILGGGEIPISNSKWCRRISKGKQIKLEFVHNNKACQTRFSVSRALKVRPKRAGLFIAFAILKEFLKAVWLIWLLALCAEFCKVDARLYNKKIKNKQALKYCLAHFYPTRWIEG